MENEYLIDGHDLRTFNKLLIGYSTI